MKITIPTSTSPRWALVNNTDTKIVVGDWVFFKADIEQQGKVVEIKGNGRRAELKLSSDDTYGFDGEYIGGETETWIESKRCWI